MPGPLPNRQRRRRNPPAIPTTNLPVGGRGGRVPAVPEAYPLKKAGRAWWKWAWKTPQAAAWDTGSIYTVVRRAQLEDDLALIDHFDPFDLAELLGMDDENKAVRELAFIIGRLKGLAGGRIAILKEMRELDNKLGLNPEALAKLRWKIVAPEEDQKQSAPKRLPANVRRLPAVDPAAAASG